MAQAAALRAFCAPTALQYDAKGNGFYVFDFIDPTHVVWTLIGSMRSEGRRLGPMEHLESVTFGLDDMSDAGELETHYEIAI
jgi:hypothetical protein